MKTCWTLTKTLLAVASVVVLLAPTLRRLGYLPPEHEADASPETSADADVDSRIVAPPELSMPSNGDSAFGFPRH